MAREADSQARELSLFGFFWEGLFVSLSREGGPVETCLPRMAVSQLSGAATSRAGPDQTWWSDRRVRMPGDLFDWVSD